MYFLLLMLNLFENFHFTYSLEEYVFMWPIALENMFVCDKYNFTNIFYLILFAESVFSNRYCHWSWPNPFICCSIRVKIIYCSISRIPAIHCILCSLPSCCIWCQINLSIRNTCKCPRLVYYPWYCVRKSAIPYSI